MSANERKSLMKHFVRQHKLFASIRVHLRFTSVSARSFVVLVGGLSLLFASSLHSARGDWLTHRGNSQRTGAADDQPGPKSPRVLWVHKTRENYIAAPVPGGKEIYMSSLGAFNTSRFDALSVDPGATKRIAWS